MLYKIIKNDRYLEFAEGALSGKKLHPLWLRERLTDEKNLDKNNLQRLYEPSLLNSKTEIKDFFQDGQFLRVTFNDGVIGEFKIKDLVFEINQHDIIPNKVAWINNIDQLPFHDFRKFNKSQDLTIKMLNDFHIFGFVIITNLSKDEGTVVSFAESLGPIRSTNFGKYFNVISKPNPNDLAYTSLGLSAHSDNPYRKPVPGIQLLHCIVNEATGGDSTLVDGLAVSNYLEKYEKHYFDILTSTEILFSFTDKDVILKNWGKLIELDSGNKFKQIRFSGRLDYVPLLDPEELTLFYKARKRLYELCSSDDFVVNFRLSNGTLVMFDNHRLLHGRTKYDPSSGNRHLQGCYIEYDATEGKLRRLLTK